MEVGTEPPADPDGVGVEPAWPARVVVTRLGVCRVEAVVVVGVAIVETCHFLTELDTRKRQATLAAIAVAV